LRRLTACLLAVVALAAGCSTADAWAEPGPVPSAVGSLKPGFTSAPPTPEATVRPQPGSWDDVHPSRGYRVVLLTKGSDEPTKALVTAVEKWAEAEDVDLRTMTAGTDAIPDIVKAMELRPDLIVGAGNELVDPLTLVSASHLDRQFLVLGAELPEPTANVTSVGWDGASFRGDGLTASSAYDPASFTAERCAAAIRAGTASVLTGTTGIILWLN
jgi:hypothetical protein